MFQNLALQFPHWRIGAYITLHLLDPPHGPSTPKYEGIFKSYVHFVIVLRSFFGEYVCTYEDKHLVVCDTVSSIFEAHLPGYIVSHFAHILLSVLEGFCYCKKRVIRRCFFDILPHKICSYQLERQPFQFHIAYVMMCIAAEVNPLKGAVQ